MKRNLKLYVWEGVLADYTSGIMFALATSADEARNIVFEKADKQEYDKMIAGESFYRGEVYRDLRGEPKVYESQVGFAVSGGS